MPISVYSLSNAILNEEARKVVEQGLVSDVFHMIDKEPRCFLPFIIHSRFKKVAGQVIESYNAINPFVAVSGSPGSGKSDFLTMQALQRAKAGDTVLIFDPTNSFCEYELISHKIPKELIDDVFLFWDMSKKGWPIDLMDFSGCANDEQMIERLSSMLISGTHFTGCNQLCILNCAVENIVKNFKGCNTDIRTILDKVLKDKGKQGEVKRRVMTLFNTIARNTETPPGWDKLLENKGKIIVISTGNATVKADCNPLDIVLDSFYSYKDSHRDGNVTLVLDEIQTLNLKEGAPIDILLSKGRKLNVGAYLASQRYSNAKDGLGRIFDYCDTKIFFKPMESCIDAVSAKTHISVDVLRCFEQGECAFIGPAYSEHKGKNTPIRNALVGKTYRPPYVGSYD